MLDVYTYLRNGSENHLRAFVKNLESRDIDYKPLVLEQETFDTIIKSEGNKGKCCSEGGKAKSNCAGGEKGKNGKGCCSKGKSATMEK